MTDMVKKIEIESKFAEAVYRQFREKRFGITPCCYTNLVDMQIKKTICDWQDLLDLQVDCEPTTIYTPTYSVTFVINVDGVLTETFTLDVGQDQTINIQP